ncbi:MAG: 4-hydroxy-tetrahydrodipicolinate synthase, partial [Pseudomonadales bacterium]
EGSIVALVTPMHIDGSVDWEALRRLVEWHISQGTHGIVSVGTTGESPTLNWGEHIEVISRTVSQAAGRIPVIAGTGANSTQEALDWTREAAERGADASLQVAPYYNRPSQEGMYQHFRTIAEAVDIPIILYNVPGRTASDISNETALRLAEVDNIVGIKDATGDMQRGAELIQSAPEGFYVYSGDDMTAFELMKLGGKGDISVTANVAPALMSRMCELALNGDFSAAEKIDQKLAALHAGLFLEPSPCATKWALQQMGLIEGGIRLPMIPLTESSQPAIRQILNELDLLL